MARPASNFKTGGSRRMLMERLAGQSLPSARIGLSDAGLALWFILWDDLGDRT